MVNSKFIVSAENQRMTKLSRQVQYSYALEKDGTLIHISKAVRSRLYYCPGCKKTLTPILGEVKAKHFRHAEECCSLETYLHKTAKLAFFHCYKSAISSDKPISLELYRNVSCQSPRLRLLKDTENKCTNTVPARYNLIHFFDHVELEMRDNVTGLQPDVMLSDSTDSRHCYVEICVSHACTKDKIATGIPILEFKIQSVDDIEMLTKGIYSIKDERLSAFNWYPTSINVETCNEICPTANIEMSVWFLSDSGRLNELTVPLSDVDLSISSVVNTWARDVESGTLFNNLRMFLHHADPKMEFENCILCIHAKSWGNGYLKCAFKGKSVPYTEACQCVSYKVEQ